MGFVGHLNPNVDRSSSLVCDTDHIRVVLKQGRVVIAYQDFSNAVITPCTKSTYILRQVWELGDSKVKVVQIRRN